MREVEEDEWNAVSGRARGNKRSGRVRGMSGGRNSWKGSASCGP